MRRTGIALVILTILALPCVAQTPPEWSGRDLLLTAPGVRVPGPGQVRIPIPTTDATYEVIVKKPGVPRLVAIDDAD